MAERPKEPSVSVAEAVLKAQHDPIHPHAS